MPDNAKAERQLYERIESEAQAGSPIRCKDLVCKDCKFRFNDSDPTKNGRRDGYGRMRGPTGRCSKYNLKPNKVLLGGECEKYERQ